jgi:cytochrome c551/c552
MKRISIGGVLAVSAVLLAGCGKSGGGAGEADASLSSPFDAGPRAAEAVVDADLAKTGEGLFKSKTCSTCHGFGIRITGPDLKGVTQRRTATWMEQQMLHPDVMTSQDPISHALLAKYAVQMPNLMLKPEEARALIEFLKRKDRDSTATR